MDLRSPDVADGKSREVQQELNAEASWDLFDSAAYVDRNYRFLRSDDAQILHMVRDHFSDYFRERPGRSGEAGATGTGRSGGPVLGIDVGAGANLYPALSMLPWCDAITLFERSAANVEYLEGQRPHYDAHWNDFWDVLCEEDAYRDLPGDEEPRARFRRTVEVQQGDLFSLDRYRGRWSMGTMFFVAESMSTSHQEFETGVERFMHALAPGAPFAAAFMEGSRGYKVGEQFFPACSVTAAEVRDSVVPYAEGDVRIASIGMPGGALRPGYEGMIVACGRRNSA
ncbi:SCO2525 family SAM-dependent methyltransferase [Streptomyces sp. NBC_01142]|uniref:SCO2525 family SAM-dependent methyltransferase n=1 Tax=Streptomyces sp. NBC_01142 TaxID=2975865 RepID=UPI00225B5485|nr:SCO2525 family SAM-dependent methyltransferase [Streptomyces sp. NBC_01142]MCX4821412.1 SCO2525 family SAM-dependent methyltransferase [Streptomyces sp. NBC_01142]